ncbi:Glypican-3 [Liparis tanakae]|uniref:Glypican-3 n=1 Tax=Liparis tanakae TaxID=230148 RepID=A0A4Z2GE34_9TELE|nr:Glypican-3 [Liparis tanakae]
MEERYQVAARGNMESGLQVVTAQLKRLIIQNAAIFQGVLRGSTRRRERSEETDRCDGLCLSELALQLRATVTETLRLLSAGDAEEAGLSHPSSSSVYRLCFHLKSACRLTGLAFCFVFLKRTFTR